MNTIRLMTLLVLVLFAITVNAQTDEIQGSIELKSKLKADFDELFKFPTTIWRFDLQNKGSFYCSEKNLRVMENGIEFRSDNENTFIGFLDMADYYMRIEKEVQNSPYVCNLSFRRK